MSVDEVSLWIDSPTIDSLSLHARVDNCDLVIWLAAFGFANCNLGWNTPAFTKISIVFRQRCDALHLKELIRFDWNDHVNWVDPSESL